MHNNSLKKPQNDLEAFQSNIYQKIFQKLIAKQQNLNLFGRVQKSKAIRPKMARQKPQSLKHAIKIFCPNLNRKYVLADVLTTGSETNVILCLNRDSQKSYIAKIYWKSRSSVQSSLTRLKVVPSESFDL